MDAIDRALEWIGVRTAGVRAGLDRYRDWLEHEAVPAGGIGPGEVDRLTHRHLADSLVFAGVWESSARPVCDVGSGVGLPGIPLAIAHPHREFLLVDRAGRRVTMARRAIRVLGLDNVTVRQADVEDSPLGGWTVVSRASLVPERLRAMVMDRDDPPAELLVGGSHVTAPVVPGFETVEIPPEILDRPVWILRMCRS